MSAPYDVAARTYLGAGWRPIPVRGKSMPVNGVTGYEGTVTLDKVEGWLVEDLTERARNGRGVSFDNLGLRHQGTLAIDVDHGYGAKNGVVQLAAWAAKVGLPPLPATWSSTARGDDSPSRQYLYRIAEDVRFKTKPCESVELCVWHHRYTVCWPSVHPDTGNVYTWYLPGEDGVPPSWGSPVDRAPVPTDLPELPHEWLVALRGGVANADRTAVVVDLPELFASFAPGEPDSRVRWSIAKWSNEAQHVGHDEAKNALIEAFMLGREGHTGVRELYEVLVDRFTSYLSVSRPDAAAHEVRELVNACATIAQQKPLGSTAPTAGTVATDEEVDTFLATFTAYTDPYRLVRREKWMRSDPPARLPFHAGRLVCDAIAGYFPADRAVLALLSGYRHHGVTNADTPKATLKTALGALLNAKVSA